MYIYMFACVLVLYLCVSTEGVRTVWSADPPSPRLPAAAWLAGKAKHTRGFADMKEFESAYWITAISH
jgi:hypothetical protein